MNFVIFYLSNIVSYELLFIISTFKELFNFKTTINLIKPWLVINLNLYFFSLEILKKLNNFFNFKLKLIPLIYIYNSNIFLLKKKFISELIISPKPRHLIHYFSINIIQNTILFLLKQMHMLINLLNYKILNANS